MQNYIVINFLLSFPSSYGILVTICRITTISGKIIAFFLICQRNATANTETFTEK